MKKTTTLILTLAALTLAALITHTFAGDADTSADDHPGLVRCANLVYARNKTSVCFSDHFLADVQKMTNIWTDHHFTQMQLDSDQLYQYPFSVMTGEGAFTLTDAQRKALHDYLTRGGFILVSSGCSSPAWQNSFRREIAAAFPKHKLEPIPFSHPIFHTVYDITDLPTNHQGGREAIQLQGLTLDGRIALVFSPDGLNDTANVGGNCCCCGGNEIRNARQVNTNLLVYAVTH